MTLLEAIQARHSVRSYLAKPLPADVIETLQEEIEIINKEADLHIQLVTDEPKAFQGKLAKYGKFSNVTNYLVLAGKKTADLDFRCGYFGEQLVLRAQVMGLNTCWVGLTYSKIPGAFDLAQNEKICCVIAIGYGETQGEPHKSKTPEQVSNVSEATPDWFAKGVAAALLAPTALNQQKFSFNYQAPGKEGELPTILAKKGFSLAGYTAIDLGIVKLHFEIGAAPARFVWK